MGRDFGALKGLRALPKTDTENQKKGTAINIYVPDGQTIFSGAPH